MVASLILASIPSCPLNPSETWGRGKASLLVHPPTNNKLKIKNNIFS